MPQGVVTVTLPVAPLPTMAVICVAELMVKLAAGVPPKATAVAPVKLVPVMTTMVPAQPEVGLNEVMVGVKGASSLILTTAISPSPV